MYSTLSISKALEFRAFLACRQPQEPIVTVVTPVQARDEGTPMHAQPGFPLCVGRSMVAQKSQKYSEAYLNIFWTYIHNVRGLCPFHINKIQFYSNLARERENEWDLDKSIHCQNF